MVGRAERHHGLVRIERLQHPLVGAEEWLHVVVKVEESALRGALALQVRGGDRDEEPVRLGAALEGDAGAVVGLAVAVQVLALVLLGDGEEVFPGLGRLDVVLREDVAAVVGHLEVAIERDRIHLALVGRAEVAEERRDVVPLKGRVGLHAIAEVLEVPSGNVVAHPLGREDDGVIAVRLRREVGEDLLVEVGERNGDDLHLRAGQLVEVGCATLERLRDLRAGERHHANGDARIGLGRGSAGCCCRRLRRTG